MAQTIEQSAEYQELVKNLSDPMWRICSGKLYKIIIKGKDDEDGLVMPFIPNRAQRKFIKRLHHRNVILKARQLGFCVAPETRVLTADLRWVPIADLHEGQEIVAVDEHPPGGRGKARRMQTATVQAVAKVHRMAYRIHFDDGRQVVCTDMHPWLSKKAGDSAQWRSLSGKGNQVVGKLRVGTSVRWITKPWDEPTFEDGWMGGMLDGEGSMALHHGSGSEVNVSQVFGPAFGKLEMYLSTRGYHYRTEADSHERKTKFGSSPVDKLCVSRMDEVFRLIGQTRPIRFLGRKFWEGKELPGKRNGDVGWSKIVKIEPVGEQTMIDLQTSTGTYIAEGFVSHNTTLIAIVWLDHALFNPNSRCGIIAQDKDAAQIIFRDKVKFAYENLPAPLLQAFPLKYNNTTELLFAHNNSSIRVATSVRSGTIHRLHISEFGKICAKHPEKAKEVMTGSIPAVPLNGVLVIESTAEGRDGEFFEISTRAQALHDAGQRLTERDYRFHFFPWYEEDAYEMDERKVVVSPSEHEYFDDIEAKAGVTINKRKRAWYIATRDADFQGRDERMWQEYPSCISGDVLVGTTKGIMPIRDAFVDGEVIQSHFNKGIRPVFKITTKLGYTVECTDDHPIKMQDGSFRKLIEGLSIGDKIAIGKPMLSTTYQHVQWNPAPFVDGKIHIDEDFAEFLGIFMGDGSFYNGTISVACEAGDLDTVEHVESMFNRYLGGSSVRAVGEKKGCLEVRKASEWFAQPMIALDIVERRLNGGLKRKVHVPSYIKQSPASVIKAFIRGLFEADGFASREGTSIKFFSKHEHVVKDIQLLLIALGIESRVSAQNKTNTGGYAYTGWELVLRANGVRKYAKEIGFISKRKQDRANISLNKRKTGCLIDFPWVDEIASVEYAGEKEVFDITTATHEFDAGGIVVHNCPEEAFQKSKEGCYYTKEFISVRKQKRLCKIPIIPSEPCYTFWDIGNSDGTAIWVAQKVGMEWRFIHFKEGWGESYSHYIQWLQGLGLTWAGMFLPHDADHQRQGATSNESPKQMLEKLMPGVRFEIVQRIQEVNWGISQTRDCFPLAYFDEDRCKEGVAHLENYSKKFNTTTQSYSDEPLHDIHSEAADAFRQWAQALTSGQINIKGGSGFKRKSSSWRTA